MELSFANGVQEYTVHGVKGDVIIRFNPTDGAFIQRLYNAFDTLDKKQDKYADEVQKCGDRVEIFNIADRRDKEMREIIDGLFEEPVRAFRSTRQSIADELGLACLRRDRRSEL